MNCQCLISGKIRKNVINLSSTEFDKGMEKVKVTNIKR